MNDGTDLLLTTRFQYSTYIQFLQVHAPGQEEDALTCEANEI